MADSTKHEAGSAAPPLNVTAGILKDQEGRKKVLGFFRRVFSGNPDGFYIHLGDTKYRAVAGAPTDEQIIAHLTGEGDGLLAAPIRADGTVRFAAIDVDRHNAEDPPIDHAKLAAAVTRLGLPLIITRSKRDDAHLWLFFKENAGFSAEQARLLLARFGSLLGFDDKKLEIFPKQKKGGGPFGSGINLPFRGMTRWAVGVGGESLDIVDFFELVSRHMSYGSVLANHYLKSTPSASDSAPGKDHSLPVRIIRELHAGNLASLGNARRGSRNDTLNTVAFFAGRAFAAKALEGTEAEIKYAIRKAALACGLDEREIAQTATSGWESGLAKGPLLLREETEVECAVAELNAKFFVIQNYGNKCRVAWFDEDDHPDLKGRLKLGHQSFTEFQNSFLNQLVEVGIGHDGKPEYEPKGHVWLRHPRRRQYWRVVFLPEQQVAPDRLNLWRGFAFEPKVGDCSLYLAHLKDIICSSNAEHYDYTLKWMALGVQRPWERGHVALVWRGDKGPGKNVAADAYAKLFGGHSMTITQAEHLVGRFNSHLRAKCVLIANEAFYAGNKQHEATLKGLITDAVLPIEQKFVDAETDVNLLHIIVLSNNDWVVPASDRERRFFMVDVSDARIGDYAYFAAIQTQLEAGGYAALLNHLLHVDLRGFNVRDVPRTEALRSQMAESLMGVESVWFECLQRGEIPGRVNKDGTVALRGTYLIDWAEKKKRRDWHGISTTKLGYLLGNNPRGKDKGMEFAKEQVKLFSTGERNQAWIIPALKEARTLWDKKRFEIEWDKKILGWEQVSV